MVDLVRVLAPRPVIRLVKRVRDDLDRRLHPPRRKKALAAMARLPAKPTILVLCHGNICRSPFAEVLLAARLGDAARVRSAGFLEGGRPSPSTALEAAREFGFDLTPHRSAQVTGETAATADLVVVMDPAQRRNFHSEFPGPATPTVILSDFEDRFHAPRGIPDPVDRPVEVFREVYRRISSAVEHLASAVPR